MQCASTSFRINSATNGGFTKAQIGSRCSEDYIGIEGPYMPTYFENLFTYFQFPTPGSSQTGFGNFQSRYCGGFLSTFPESTTDAKIKG